MKKNIMKFSAYLCAVTMLVSVIAMPSYVLAETVPTLISVGETESLNVIETLVESITLDEGEELNIDDITDEELLEAEPSELPEAVEDLALTTRLQGMMLLDVEGNGEVYYIDPVTEGKEYLADGEAAQLLLKRKALGINEENFSKLVMGENKDEPSVCEESALGKRLRGRIVLRVEENGEAYWILPTNCRAYYAGTFEASYELMKRFSLGIVKNDLAKIPDNKRQKMKTALRLSVYAHADNNDMTLENAKDDLKKEVNTIKVCMEDFRVSYDGEMTSETNKTRVGTCVQKSNMPRISEDRGDEIKEMIKETREERKESASIGQRQGLRDINMRQIAEKVRKMIANRAGQ